jgi:putative multiple sugar transport system permease protein
MSKTSNFLSKYALLGVLLIVMLVFQGMIVSGNKGSLFSAENITNLIGQNGYVVILATGMLLCILTGGNIDLSVGSMIILVGGICGILMVDVGLDPYVTVIVGLCMGAALGAWQAFWIAYVRIPPFIATLAGMLAFRGLALFLMNSQNKGPLPENFKALFNNFIPYSFMSPEDPGFARKIMLVTMVVAIVICIVFIVSQIVSNATKKRKGYAVDSAVWMIVKIAIICAVILFVFWRLGSHKGIPVALIWLGAIVLFYQYFTQNTVPGRYLDAMGGNEKAARLSGVNTKKMMFFAYTNMGGLAGVAALVCIARYNQAGTTLGTGFELDAIGACFIGGASAYGGIGTVGGAVIGAIFMGVLNMGMSILGADPNLQRLIKGMVLLAAVIFDVMSKNRKQAA